MKFRNIISFVNFDEMNFIIIEINFLFVVDFFVN